MAHPDPDYQKLKARIDSLPLRAGVYIFKDADGDVLYVGKSVKLRSRVRSYFTSREALTPAKQKMVPLIFTIDFLVAVNEAEALIMEYELIRTHMPPYNIMFKDDKSYPMLKITKERYPRLIVTRKRIKDGASYFGPYPDSRSVRLVARSLRTLFPLRKCRTPSSLLKKVRPCLYFEMGACCAPCSDMVSDEEYLAVAEKVTAILKGGDSEIIDAIKKSMVSAASRYEFEKAAEFRDMIRAFGSLRHKQRVVGSLELTCDVIAIARKGNLFSIQLLMIRKGRMAGERHTVVDSPVSEASEVLSRYLADSYILVEAAPSKIFTSIEPSDADILRIGFREKFKKVIDLTVPKSGKGRRLLEMAYENARMRVDVSEDEDALNQAVKLLNLKKTPVKIECIDISISKASNAVGSLVVFRNGRPEKSSYRRFTIKTVDGTDDFAMMSEVVGRRYSRLKEERAELPDLLIVDGGKGQVSAALESLERIGMNDLFPVLGLAKKEERIVGNGLGQGVVLPKGNSLRRLFERIRDEPTEEQ